MCLVVCVELFSCVDCFLFQAEDGIRDLVRSRGLGDVYKRQILNPAVAVALDLHLHAQLEVLDGASTPDEKLIVGEVLGALRFAGQRTVLDLSLIHI